MSSDDEKKICIITEITRLVCLNVMLDKDFDCQTKFLCENVVLVFQVSVNQWNTE